MIILGTNSIKDTGFDVANSVRYNDGDSPKLNINFGSDGTLNKWTFSMWFKRSTLGTAQRLFCVLDTGMDDYIKFDTSDRLEWTFDNEDGTNKGVLLTNRKFRDVSAWYHIVCRLDTTDGTAGDRMRIYVNGVEETSFATDTNPTQNETGDIGRDNNHFIGTSGSSQYFDGYFAEVCMINNQSLAPTSFGEFDEDSGIWKPIDVSGLTAGTNGFYLDFEDSSNLGNDAFGGTDWTETNLTATDQSTDTCTNNFCTINPLVNGTQRNPTLSEGNTFLTNTSGAWMNCLSSFAASSGKWYFEIKPTLHGTSYVHAGIFPVDDWQNQVSGYPNFGGTANSWSYDSDGNIVNNDGNANTSPATYTTNDIIGIAVDLDNNKFYAYKNNALQVSGGTTITANTEYYFGGMGYNSNIAFNFGNPSYANTSDAADGNGYGNFEYAPPSGYYALNTKNLAEYG